MTDLKRELLAYQEDHHNNQEIDPDNNEDDTIIRTLTICKGPFPNKRKGSFHHMLNLAWNRNKIETILDSENNDLIYLFYVNGVSRVVQKRKWNECSQVKPLRNFVDPSDEAFTMSVLENNTPKWMDELVHGDNIG